jgi:hypothetical protein
LLTQDPIVQQPLSSQSHKPVPPTAGAIHAGHQYGGSHVFTPPGPGQMTKVGAQTTRGSFAQAADEARAAAVRRGWSAAHPNGPHLPVPVKSR